MNARLFIRIFAIGIVVIILEVEGYLRSISSKANWKSRLPSSWKKDLDGIRTKKISPTAVVNFIYQQYGLIGLVKMRSHLMKSSLLSEPLEISLLESIKTKATEARKISDRTLDPALARNYVLNAPGGKSSRECAGRSIVLDAVDREYIAVLDASSDKLSKRKNLGSVPSLRKIKLIPSIDRFNRELSNMKKLRGSDLSRKSTEFVPYFLYLPQLYLNGNMQQNFSGIVMDAGSLDVMDFAKVFHSSNQHYEDPKSAKLILKRTMLSMVKIVQAIHRRGLVWTDLKLTNFVLMPKDGKSELEKELETYFSNDLPSTTFLDLLNYDVRAIDLESATSRNSPLLDFSPEAIAPEHAFVLSQGTLRKIKGPGNNFEIQLSSTDQQQFLKAFPAQDVWALGLAFVSLATGRFPLGTGEANLSLAVKQIQEYSSDAVKLDATKATSAIFSALNSIEDLKLKSLISSMLQVEPSQRIPLFQVALRLAFW